MPRVPIARDNEALLLAAEPTTIYPIAFHCLVLYGTVSDQIHLLSKRKGAQWLEHGRMKSNDFSKSGKEDYYRRILGEAVSRDSPVESRMRGDPHVRQVKNHNRTGGACQDGLVAIGRTCGWIESYALKFFKSGFMDKPSAKRRRNAISQSQLRSPLRSFRTAPWASLKAKMWNSAS
ncbi:hypothetical protein Tco_0168208 [Tanacetum coccineum]